jgi:hypothetical protein
MNVVGHCDNGDDDNDNEQDNGIDDMMTTTVKMTETIVNIVMTISKCMISDNDE